MYWNIDTATALTEARETAEWVDLEEAIAREGVFRDPEKIAGLLARSKECAHRGTFWTARTASVDDLLRDAAAYEAAALGQPRGTLLGKRVGELYRFIAERYFQLAQTKERYNQRARTKA